MTAFHVLTLDTRRQRARPPRRNDQTAAFARHALCPRPKTGRFVPMRPDIALVIGDAAPDECKALAQICETADLLVVDDQPWLLVPATHRLLDTLASFGASLEDREPDLEDEEEVDDDRDSDNPADQGGIDFDDEPSHVCALDFAADREEGEVRHG